jgi:Protein of unknown function (DUF2585)
MKKLVPWLVLGGVLLFAGVMLRTQGRLWMCSCGYVRLWSGNINSGDNSQQLFDPYTFTHVIHGFLFIAIVQLLWPRMNGVWQIVSALSAEALWEVIENSNFVIQRYRSETVSLGYVGDTVLNSFGDILACAFGIVLARRLGVARTVALAFAIEAILLFTIRDNLTLNIVMLLYPVEAIRHWQLGH